MSAHDPKERLTEYELQVLLGTSIHGCNMSPDRVFSLNMAWHRLHAIGLIDRTDGLAIITNKGKALVEAMLSAASPKGQVEAVAEARKHFIVEYKDDGTVLFVGHDNNALRKVVSILDAALSPAPAGGWKTEVVWLVRAQVGVYSDRQDWTVGAWRNEEEAREFVAKIDALGKSFEQAARDRFDSDEQDVAADKAEADCKALDSQWKSYCGDAPEYRVWPETVRVLPAAPSKTEFRPFNPISEEDEIAAMQARLSTKAEGK